MVEACLPQRGSEPASVIHANIGVISGMWTAIIPQGLLAWLDRRTARRELDKLQRLDEISLALDDMNLVNRAKAALALGDQVEAERCWDEAMVRYPKFAQMSRDACRILVGISRFDNAEVLMREGMRRAPRDFLYSEGYAYVAEARGDVQEAVRRWRRVQKAFPGHWAGYVRAASCMQRLGESKTADVILGRAVKRFSNVVEVWGEWARVAESLGNWAEALQRWEVVAQRFNAAAGEFGAVRALIRLGQIDGVDKRLVENRVRFPTEIEAWMQPALVAYERGDKLEAARRWRETRQRFPLDQLGYEWETKILVELGQLREAEEVLRIAMDRFPEAPWTAMAYASLSRDRGDQCPHSSPEGPRTG